MLDIFEIERRYTVFDKKTFSRLITLLKTMTTYTMDKPYKRKVVDYYFDNEEMLLEKNELLLRKRVLKNKAQLKIKRFHYDPSYYYRDSLRANEREKDIGVFDSLARHYFFLNNALNSMFTHNLQFDPDKLFDQMRVIMVIKSKQEIRKLFGYGGLKVEITNEKLSLENKITNRKNNFEIVQFKLVSPEDTLPVFKDFITRIERHCKEIFYTRDSKYEIAYRMTRPLPTKEEAKKRQEELLRQKMLQESEEAMAKKEKK